MTTDYDQHVTQSDVDAADDWERFYAKVDSDTAEHGLTVDESISAWIYGMTAFLTNRKIRKHMEEAFGLRPKGGGK